MSDVPDAPANNPARTLHAELHAELRTELRNWCEAWKTCLQNVLSQISGDASGKTTAFEISSEPLPSTDSDLWYTVVAGGAAHGEMTLRLPAASGTRLAQKFVGETEPAPEGIPEGITPDHKEALEEFLRQIAGLAATALAATAGGEVQLHLSPSAAPSWSSDAIVCCEPGTKLEAIPPSPSKFRSAPPSPPRSRRACSPRPPRKHRRQHLGQHRRQHRPRLPRCAASWMSAWTSNSASEPAACCCAMCSPSIPGSSSNSIARSIHR